MIDTNTLNKHLLHSLQEGKIPLGLANGKMGICIYFYSLSRIDQDAEFGKIAESLLDEIFDNINTIQTIDVKSGLTGIGIGIDYLIKNNYVQGNSNIILKDIDDIIFKNLSYYQLHEKLDFFSLNHILYYLCIRLRQQRLGSENEYLYKELIIQTVNNLYERLPVNFHEEPLSYTADYTLPQVLFVLGEICELNFYSYRIYKILEELNYKVLSTLPTLNSNRLYLLWGMDYLNRQIQNANWQRHILLIKEQIDLDYILNHELKNKNIYFHDGLASICFFIRELAYYFDNKELEIFWMQAASKIENSQVWTLLNEDLPYFEKYMGLYTGFPGAVLLLHKLQSQNYENEFNRHNLLDSCPA